jgi:hypothetical protein
MFEKNFKIQSEDIKKVMNDNRGCVATDRITIDGLNVGFMYREKPDEDIENDSGWRFFSGDESQEYLDDYNNSQIYSLNTIANYDSSIIPNIKLPIGTELERIEGTDKFQKYEEE